MGAVTLTILGVGAVGARRMVRRRRFEREQLAKGFVRYEDRRGTTRWGTPEEVQRWKEEERRREEEERKWLEDWEARRGTRETRTRGVLLSCLSCNRDLSQLAPNATRCPYCGRELERREVVIEMRVKKPSAAWYLLPLLFGIIGGLIAYVAVKDEDRGMAWNLLFFGVVMTVLGILIWFAILGVSTIRR